MRVRSARAACLPRVSLGPALARARRTVDRSRACSPPAMPRMRSFPPKPIDAGESLPSVPRAIADPPLSPSAHQQHLRDVLRREARLRREGREGRQGRHRRPRRVRGHRLGTLTLTTTRSYPIPISARSGVTAGREARANEAEGDARNARESASSARRARSLASSPPVAGAGGASTSRDARNTAVVASSRARRAALQSVSRENHGKHDCAFSPSRSRAAKDDRGR